MTTFHECCFAPFAATRRDVIRVAQLIPGESVREAFAPRAFAGWGARDIPILLDHDPNKRAGTVTGIAAHGDWWHGSFVLDGPHAERGADYLARFGAGVPRIRTRGDGPQLRRTDQRPSLPVPLVSPGAAERDQLDPG
jgi:hypothetical protein